MYVCVCVCVLCVYVCVCVFCVLEVWLHARDLLSLFYFDIHHVDLPSWD